MARRRKIRVKKWGIPFMVVALLLAWLAASGKFSPSQDEGVEEAGAGPQVEQEPQPQAEPTVVSERWSGANRFATAATVARNSYPAGAEVVYLASHTAFADPMVAGQAVPPGPILLAGTVPLHRETCEAINDLQPTSIVVIGGERSVPASNISSAETCVEMSPGEEEERLSQLTNQERTERGLNVLGLHERLRGDARAWARHMVQQGFLSHSTRPAWCDCDLWGENVVGPADDADQAHAALMNSPLHRANILGVWDVIGYGLVIYKDRIWATQQFIQF